MRKESASGTRKYVFDLQNPFTETDGSDVTQAVYVVEPQTYGNIVSQRQLVGGIWNSVYHHFDALGSTGSLSDSMAVVTDTYTYTAFGETKASTGTTREKSGPSMIAPVGTCWGKATYDKRNHGWPLSFSRCMDDHRRALVRVSRTMTITQRAPGDGRRVVGARSRTNSGRC
jgi:hypothetical protein